MARDCPEEYDPHNPHPDEPLPDTLLVRVGRDDVVIVDEGGYEVVYWHKDEWKDPGVTRAISNAINLAHTDPQELILRLWGPGEWPNQRNLRDEPAWEDSLDGFEKVDQ